jgi:uncharacterized protein YndB with AHSA1/START domain
MADIVHLIQIAASPDSVYELVGTSEGFTRWWAEDLVKSADGSIELGFFDRSTVYRFRAVDLRANEHASWRCESGHEWQGTTLEFVLQPGESGVVLRFNHRDWQAQTDYFATCNTTWGELMFRLKATAEGKAPGPLFSRSGMAY